MVEPATTPWLAYIQPFTRFWPLFASALLLALVAAFAYLSYKQPIYRIQASLLIQDEKRGNQQANPLKEIDTYAPKKAVENELEVLRSAALMTQVVNQLSLQTRYFRQTSFGKRELYPDAPIRLLVEKPTPSLYDQMIPLELLDDHTLRIDKTNYPLNQPINTPFGRLRVLARTNQPIKPTTLRVQVMTTQAAVAMYLNNLRAEPTSKTSSVIHLTLEEAVPQKGEAILNALIRHYNQAAITDKNQLAYNTLRFVDNRLRLVATELAGVEKRVETFKASRGITDLSAQDQAVLQTAQQTDAQLAQVDLQLAQLDQLQQLLNADQTGSTPATLGLSDPLLLGQLDKLAQLELQRDQLRQTTSQANPLLLGLDQQIQATKANIRHHSASLRTLLTSARQQHQAKNQLLAGNLRSMPQQERTLLDISRQQAIKNNLYTYLLQKREELAVSFAAAVADSRTIDGPTSSPTPVKPVALVIYALFGLVGLLVPTAGLLARQALSTRVSHRSQVEAGTQAPILGEIMHKPHRELLVVGGQHRSVMAEQIRQLRASLQRGPGAEADQLPLSQLLLCTSSISGEGKSFISLNLGASLALLRQPTVIVEMDMRRPRLHQWFGLANTVGLSSYLNGEATLEQIIQPVPGYPNYFIIPSGPLPADPSELLSGPLAAQLLTQLRGRFRYVVLDAPPVGIVADAQVVAPYVDETLFVVRHGVTPRQSLKQLDVLYREQQFPRLRIILNGVGQGESYHSSHHYKNSYAYR